MFAAELLLTILECSDDARASARTLREAMLQSQVSGFRLDTVLVLLRILGIPHETVFRRQIPTLFRSSSSRLSPAEWMRNLPNGWSLVDIDGIILHSGNHFTFLVYVPEHGWAQYDWTPRGLVLIDSQTQLRTLVLSMQSVIVVGKFDQQAAINRGTTARSEAAKFVSELMTILAALAPAHGHITTSTTAAAPTPSISASSDASSATASKKGTKRKSLAQVSRELDDRKEQVCDDLMSMHDVFGSQHLLVFFDKTQGMSVSCSNRHLNFCTTIIDV